MILRLDTNVILAATRSVPEPRVLVSRDVSPFEATGVRVLNLWGDI